MLTYCCALTTQCLHDTAATANSQVLVECYTLSTTCMPVFSFEVVMKEDCCSNSVEPLGGSFFEDGIEGCQTCDVGKNEHYELDGVK